MMGKLSLFGSISQTCLEDLWGRRPRKSIIECVGDIGHDGIDSDGMEVEQAVAQLQDVEILLNP
jgi:hypothetical protein